MATAAELKWSVMLNLQTNISSATGIKYSRVCIRWRSWTDNYSSCTEEKVKKRSNLDNGKRVSGSKEALDFIDTEKTWSFHYKNTTADGNKSYYRCNKIKLRSHQCPAGIYLLDDCRNEDVFLFRALENHDHSMAKSNHGLSDEVKREIDTLFTLKLKPEHILAKLREKGLPVKNKTQINNYIMKIKDKKYGKSTISLGEFEQLCQMTRIKVSSLFTM